MLRIGKANRDGFLGAVTAGLNPKVVEPEIVVGARFCRHPMVAYPVTVHSAVEVHARNTISVRCEHIIENGHIGHPSSTFVVNDNVVALGVVGVAVDSERRAVARVVRVYLVNHNIGPSFETFLDNILLRRIRMATTAGNQKHLEGLGRLLGLERRGECNQQRRCRQQKG